MSSQKTPPFLALILTIVIGGGIAVAAFVHAQTGTTVAKTFSGSATLQYGDAGGTVENNVTIHQKVIYLKNTGSDPDTFRTTLPVNPESRCGISGQNGQIPPIHSRILFRRHSMFPWSSIVQRPT